MTFAKELRDAAMQCSNADYRTLLRGAADYWDFAVRWFADCPNAATLTELNSTFAWAHRALKNIPPEAPPAPLAGSPEPARLAA